MEFSAYFGIWDRLTQGEQQRLKENAVLRTASRGTVLHRGELDCAGLFLVGSGQLRSYILSNEGREITLYRLFPRDLCLLSASCMIRSIQFEITVEAEKDTRFWVIPPGVYREMMESSPVLANYTGEIMATRFSDVMWLMEQILWKSFDKRLAGFLLEESALEDTTVLKITHETIGSHLGNPREVVTRMLRYFQNEGMVRLSRGTVELTDIPKLEAAAR